MSLPARLTTPVLAVALALVAVVAIAPASPAEASTKRFSSHAKVRLSGSPAVGSTLKASPRSWGAKKIHYRYRWYASGKRIAGLNSRSITVLSGAAGQRLTVKVTGKKRGYRTSTESRSVVIRAQGTPQPPATPSGNQPGAVYLNGGMITGSEHSYYDPGTGTSYWNRVFYTYGSTISRSPATSGTQHLKVTYYLQSDQHGSWQALPIGFPTYTGTFAGGTTSLTTAAWGTEPPQPGNGRVNWRFVYVVEWSDAGGNLIGFSTIVPSRPEDSVCQTRFRLCTAYVGGLYF